VSIASIHDLTVKYGSFEALKDFTVDVPEGAVGLLGPNGAGKTTLIKTILGFVTPAKGRGEVLGYDMSRDGANIRQIIGYMPEQDCHIPGMSAVQYVAYAGELSGLPPQQALRRAHEVLEYSGLGEARYRHVETYSTGMKQRIKFAQALVHGPKLLLLDEPTNGLDPRGREEMLNLVKEVASEKGISVLVCSHLLPDIERTCESVIVLMNGTLRASGKIRDLKSISGQPIDVELREDSDVFIAEAQKLGLQLISQTRHTFRLQGTGTVDESAKAAFLAAEASKSQIRHLVRAERSLEDAFLEAVTNG
jgi:ABC-2 type transport system ATP-binding protein